MDRLAGVPRVFCCQKLNRTSASIWAGLITCLLMLGCSSDQPPVQQAQVLGSSMYPVMVGSHLRLKCQDCRYHFLIDADNLPRNRVAACPNCGNQEVAIGLTDNRKPDLFEVRPIQSTVQRWDVVSFRIPEGLKSSGHLGVKRVVGLPTEKIQLAGGEILVNDEIAHRPYEIQKKMRIPIHDNRFQAADSDTRWQAPDGWSNDNGTWVFDPAKNPVGQKWLAYRHVASYRTVVDHETDVAIQDSYGYNQNLARSLNIIRDVALEVEVSAGDQARLTFGFELGQQSTVVELDFGQKQVKLSNGKREMTAKLPAEVSKQNMLFDVTNFDGRAILALDGQPIAESQWQVEPMARPKTGLKLKIGGAHDWIRISRIKVWRDFYPFLENSESESETWTLGADEYFLLGDNCPVSVDSRKFGPVTKQNLLGILDLGRN